METLFCSHCDCDVRIVEGIVRSARHKKDDFGETIIETIQNVYCSNCERSLRQIVIKTRDQKED